MVRVRPLLASLAVLAVLAAPAGAGGVIKGQLWLSRKAMQLAHTARDPGTPSASAKAATRPVPVSMTKAPASKPLVFVPQPGVADAVIYIEKVPEKVERKYLPPKNRPDRRPLPRIVQMKQRYVPRVLVATVGTAVVFENLDRVYHNTFSVSVAKRFDLGKYPPGHCDTVRFERRGVANLHCDIHPDEIGFVALVPNHIFARPDSLGRFALPKLPPGDYKVRTWHPRLGELTREVTMPKHGDLALELNY